MEKLEGCEGLGKSLKQCVAVSHRWRQMVGSVWLPGYFDANRLGVPGLDVNCLKRLQTCAAREGRRQYADESYALLASAVNSCLSKCTEKASNTKQCVSSCSEELHESDRVY